MGRDSGSCSAFSVWTSLMFALLKFSCKVQVKEMLRDDIAYYLRNREVFDGAKDASLEAYRTDLNKLLEYCEREGYTRSDQITERDLKEMIGQMASQGASGHTLRRMISTMRGYFSSLVRDGQMKEDPSEILSAVEDAAPFSRTPEDPLTQEQMDRLIEAAGQNRQLGTRDAAILGLLCGTGMRSSELLGLRLCDIEPVICYVTAAAGTQNERRIPFPGTLYPILEKYLRTKGSDFSNRNDILFRNRSHSPLSRQGLWKLVHNYGRRAGIEGNVTPDRIRYSVMVRLSESGADEEHICSIMGYHSVTALRAAMNKPGRG